MVRSAGLATYPVIRLNIYDEFNGTNTYKPLCVFTSQASGSSITTIPFGYSFVNKERYVQLTFLLSTLDIPASGFIKFGNTDLPYGLYDTSIYENSSNTNLNPSGLNVVWKGLANLTAQQTGTYKNPAIEYKDYTTNDSDTESVYITF
tara:strand:+ start:22 stop:465 length:444 start_codon:yes stop_codon:yes gene_type:complete